jgi:polyhydroxyalkanoate synthase
MKGPAKADTGEKWSETAKKHEGTWWLDWAEFLKKKSGAQVKSPETPGSKKYPVIGPAPGTYVFED